MPSVQLDGEPVPADGALPRESLGSFGARPFGFYVHVPYCASRCGYCDFNTYTATELGGGASQAGYAQHAIAEIRQARKVLGESYVPVETVFFGGGTPTLLPAKDLVAMLKAIKGEFGLSADVEVTTEANPESVDEKYLVELAEGGFNRISFGMQSTRPHVLELLERRHTPGRPEQCVRWAYDAGFEQVNLDLIYGTPGETEDDWRASLEAVISAYPDHVSAYSLIVEDGTRLASRIRRGELPMIDEDVHADRYLMTDQLLGEAGYRWYEVSNWAVSEDAHCRHNMLYWTGADWWGVGPGAHSHIGGTRWWNVKHPTAYAQRIEAGHSPGLAREVLTAEDRRIERILLELRIAEGLELGVLSEKGRSAAELALQEKLLEPLPFADGHAVLTLRGRLLADAIVRDLTD
ncbi:coproporphyrinogen III oxidase [Actinospica sp. MGRD01-02]|uniref:Heme chaperone HemW n=1 Tax=Actinospica acidithermotolerans TaxID=2828514 RepID=A0A941ILI7_9ACTN|nr:radical SAM family heme chaperone HemW [Actinospica acidithermotolerans]MBR7830052.1 coproporphyrinogen III oxidase [Actinospica acidithermotolerans]